MFSRRATVMIRAVLRSPLAPHSDRTIRRLSLLRLLPNTSIRGSTLAVIKGTTASVPFPLFLFVRFSVTLLLLSRVRPKRAALLLSTVLGLRLKEDIGMKRIFRVSPPLLFGLWLVGCDHDPLTDLSIRSIEIMQGASASADAVGLVGQGSTTVRVRLETDSSYNVTGVTGLLSVSVDGVVVETDLPAVNEPITVSSTRDRASGDASLDFENALAGISASSNVDFFVTLTAPGQFVQGRAFDLTFAGPSPSSADHPSCVNPSSPMLMSPGAGEVSVRGNGRVTAGHTERYPPTPGNRGMFDPVLADARKSPP